MRLSELSNRIISPPSERIPEPNAPCWCGSGKRYRRCHLVREAMPKLTRQQSIDLFRRTGILEVCLHPGAGPGACVGGIIKAHTVQRGGGLSRIAEGGHVLGFELNKSAGRTETKPIGIRRASTFTGFCGRHDQELFLPLETVPFDPLSRKQILLLMYRALCMEVYKKRREMQTFKVWKEHDRGRTYHEQRRLHMDVETRALGTRMGIRDAELLKERCDLQILSGDFSATKALVVEFSTTPDLVCSAGMAPECDFTGAPLQDLDTIAPLDYVACSLIPTATGGAFILSWIESTPASERLARSFDAVPDDQVGNAVLRFCFEHFENTYFRQSWWNGLAEGDRDALVQRFRRTVESAIRPVSCLLDDGLRTVAWPVSGRHRLF